jgi:SAM-dependent methyltransferase|uniref:Class I SAM-dependent methyltransferase n=1 Tax=candidate division WOR-3 bacterium TaxID=2052148 RepID=A0A7C6EDI0_UNCW3
MRLVKKLPTWEEVYRNVESLWGAKPDRILVDYATLIPKGKVLDLGIGEGRNGLFFAKLGYEVEGFDISPTAIKRCIERAKDLNLEIKAKVQDLKKIKIPKGKYSLIISAWVLNFFTKSDAVEIVKKIKAGLTKDGFVYIGVFSIADPGYEKSKKNLEPVDENTFYSPARNYFIHYFTKEEFLSFFSEFKIIYFADGTELDLGHGEPHYHGFIEYLGQKC